MVEQGLVLDMLTVLQELEECMQIPLFDKAYNMGSDRSSPLHILSLMEC